ncbi:dual specificity protein phosphatase family protein [Pseudomonas anguilliseptica]|uniref:Dual specificity phosphatase, catalytic domain n=1 Tax=Pseudomonas anguilliseptica TaxID=53406 RepID=A0A1H4ZPN8_PSEAG|nr:dual specificity protein phosphatase family protein [Pseudomonas anguilliseptica]SED31967.1 Dual specificity phosphatase, catalytic domain [Pseudomonas anguilliseptica]
MSHPFDALSIPNRPGRLIFTPCPGTKDSSIDSALNTLKQAGADAVLTLMPYAELAQNAASDLPALCAAQDLLWLYLPVADEQVPQADFDAAWPVVMAQITELLAANKAIAIHCKGGSGRTGLIAARILVELGIERSEAVSLVQALRPKAIQHPAHAGWLAQFGN